MCESLFLYDEFVQGALLGQSQVQALLDSNELKNACDLNVSNVDYWLVISHDCDLARPADKDSLVELLPCHKKLDDSKPHLNGFSSRQLEILVDSEVYTIYSFEKHIISKSDLIKSGICPVAVLNERDLKLLYTWLPSRYARSNLPEELNKVLNKAFNNRKLKITKAKDVGNHQDVVGLWFDYYEEEYDDGSNRYDLTIYLVYLVNSQVGMANAIRLKDILTELLGAEPLICNFEVYTVDTSNFTYDLVLNYTHWTYDYLCV